MMSPGQILILASLAANAVLGWAGPTWANATTPLQLQGNATRRAQMPLPAAMQRRICASWQTSARLRLHWPARPLRPPRKACSNARTTRWACSPRCPAICAPACRRWVMNGCNGGNKSDRKTLQKVFRAPLDRRGGIACRHGLCRAPATRTFARAIAGGVQGVGTSAPLNAH